MKLPSASKLDLASHCVWPYWAHETKSVYETSPASEVGKIVHAYAAEHARIPAQRRTIAQLVDAMRTDAIKRNTTPLELSDTTVSTATELCHAWDAHAAPSLAGKLWQPESLMAYDPVTDSAEAFPGVDPQDGYKVCPTGAFRGTADVLYASHDTVTVVDWKCGRPENVAPIASHKQMRFLGLAAARAWGLPNARIILAYVGLDGITAEQHTLGTDDLHDVRNELLELQARIDRREAPTIGDHCRWCHVRASCPTTRSALQTMSAATSQFAVVADARQITGPDHATWLLNTLKRVRLAAVDVESALKAWSDEHDGIPISDGVWGRKEVAIEHVRLTPDGLTLLEARLPASITTTVTKSSLEQALRADGRLPTVEMPHLMAQLRDTGSVMASVQVRYERR